MLMPDKAVRIEKCVSSDITRSALMHLQLEIDEPNAKGERNGRLVATDGHLLTTYPVEVDPEDTPGFITLEAFGAARKLKSSVARIRCTPEKLEVLPGGPTFTRPLHYGEGPGQSPDAVAYPDWRRALVRAEDSPKRAHLTLNAELLLALQRASGADMVTISVGDGDQPLIVYGASAPTESLSILMPARMTDCKCGAQPAEWRNTGRSRKDKNSNE